MQSDNDTQEKNENREIFSLRQNKLLNFAGITRSLAIIVLIFTILIIIFNLIEDFIDLDAMIVHGTIIDYYLMLLGNWNGRVAFLNMVFQRITWIIGALLGYFVLTGISLGLRMIVEIDFNKNINADVKADNETGPVFYSPQQVLALKSFLTKLAWVVSIGMIIVYFVSLLDRVINSDPGFGIVGGNVLLTIVDFLYIILKAAFMFYSLAGISHLLSILIEYEFNTRGER